MGLLVFEFCLASKMDKFPESFKASVIGNIRKEYLLRDKGSPNEFFVEYVLNKLALNPGIKLADEFDTKRWTNALTENVVKIAGCSFPSESTFKIQMYFDEHYCGADEVLRRRQETVRQSTELLLQHIFQKRIKRNKEDSDQLYHNICCYVILVNGIGDPTNGEVLKETTDALKSILTSKEIGRFTLKPDVYKEKQLADICSIVTGILIYNQDSKKTEDGDFISTLRNSFEKYSCFLECKLRSAEKQICKLTRMCLKFCNVSSSMNCMIEEFQDIEKYAEMVNYAKSYIILLQQWVQYLRVLTEGNNRMLNELDVLAEMLGQRVQRVRKTVKHRTAIPVVEIYPQFRDISSAWDKYQELSTLLDYFSNVMYDLNVCFEKVCEPDLNVIPDYLKCDMLKMEVRDKETIRNENDRCKLIMPEEEENFYGIPVQYSGFCAVTFVNTQGVLVAGIKEYGIVKYCQKYYVFSTLSAMTNFCQKPERYISEIKNIIFLWPETVTLLNMESYFQSLNYKNSTAKSQNTSTGVEMGIQTDIHPPLRYNYQPGHSPYVLQLRKRMSHSTSSRKQTHSVQTLESSFRRNTSTQTNPATGYK